MSNFRRKILRRQARSEGLPANTYLPSNIQRQRRKLDKALKKAMKIIQEGQAAADLIKEAAAELAAEEERNEPSDN